MKLVIVLSVVVVALAAPEGYHYDRPEVSSTLYFPSFPSYAPEIDDCVEPEAHGNVEYQHQLPILSQVQQTSHVYQAPVVQPLKTQVTYEKQQVLQVQHQPQVVDAGSWKAQEQQASVWGSSGSGHQQEQQIASWGSSGSGHQQEQQISSWGSSGSGHQQEQQASLWGSSSAQQSLGSASWSSGEKKQASVWVKPQHTVEEVFKHVYVHIPPEDKEEYESPRVIQPVSHKQKHYKIIFIKAPSPPAPKSVVVPPQPSNEEKTIVYVLHQKPEHQQEVIVQKPEPTKQNKPEVFFIKYKNRKEEQKQVKYVAPVVATKSVKVVDSGSIGYSSGSAGSKYSFESSTLAPASYSTTGSKNTGASYSYVSSTPAPAIYSSPQTVQYVETGSNGYSGSSSSGSSSGSEGYQYSNLGNTGSSYSSFTNGAGAGYESYVDLGNSGYSSYSNGGSLGIINADSHSDYQFVPSTTLAPVVKVTTPAVSYVSSTQHSVVGSTQGDISVKNPGLSGYSSRTSGSHSQASSTTAAPAKKVCRRCASTTSSTLNVQDAYVSSVY
ncbi:uncharacterized protein LOC135716924 [Ochlerotatus camptorhynchus]|uniref:uncharacterized protein LOC135716924 n=1 Tax=Ochlerotatus camptorhynchus TaxID=644619 RepID=UPI0031D5761F